jgi:predicted RNA-binding protein
VSALDLGGRKMCLGKVYQSEESNEPLLENIAHLRLEGDQVELETLFGEKKAFQGRLREIDFVRSRIIMQS